MQEELKKATSYHESLLRKKSRCKWIAEGDSNTKYFHLVINWRRRKDMIQGLHTDGLWVEEPRRVKGVLEFFQQRFIEVSFKKISYNH